MIKWPKSVVSSSRMTNQFFRVTHLNGYSVSLFGCLIGSSIINKFRTEILVQPQLKICPTSKLLLLLDFLTHCQWYPDDHTTNMKEKKMIPQTNQLHIFEFSYMFVCSPALHFNAKGQKVAILLTCIPNLTISTEHWPPCSLPSCLTWNTVTGS